MVSWAVRFPAPCPLEGLLLNMIEACPATRVVMPTIITATHALTNSPQVHHPGHDWLGMAPWSVRRGCVTLLLARRLLYEAAQDSELREICSTPPSVRERTMA